MERPLGFALLSLPFLGVALEVGRDLPGPNAQFVIGTSAALAFAVAVLTLEQERPLDLPNLLLLAGLLAFSLAAYADPSLIGPYGGELLLGVLLGAPWILVAYVARPDEHVGLRFAVYAVAIIFGLFVLAAALTRSGSSPESLSSSIVTQFFGLAGQQFQVFGGLLNGATAPGLPLNALFDPTYAGLTAVSLAGLVLVTARPQTGGRTPLPVAVRAFRETDREKELPPEYGFSPGQREAFRDRSTGESPLLTWPPGLEPIFYGAAAALGFLAAAYFEPKWTVLGGVAAVAVAALWFVWAVERPMAAPPARVRRAPATPPSDEGADIAPPAVAEAAAESPAVAETPGG